MKPARIVGTGALIELDRSVEHIRGRPTVLVCCFAEVEIDGASERRPGSAHGGDDLDAEIFDGAGDPTTVLVEAGRRTHELLGNLLGDLRREGHDITRWEIYAAPFRIELTDEVRDLLGSRLPER